MRNTLVILVSLVLFGEPLCFAQKSALHFNTYAERACFIEPLDEVFANKQYRQIADSLRLLEQRAADAGDDQLFFLLQLFKYTRQFSEKSINPDSLENRIKYLITDATQKQQPYLLADAIQTLGDYYISRQQPAASIESYIAAYDIYKNFTGEEYPFKRKNIYVLGGSFYSLEDYGLALKYLREAQQTKPSRIRDYLCPLYNLIGLCYRNTRKYDSAILYFDLTYAEAIKDSVQPYEGIAAGNKGICYFLQNKYDAAIPLLQKDVEISLITSQYKNAAGSMAKLATIYIEQQRYDNALQILQRALNICENRPFWPNYPLQEQLFTQLYKVYAAKKDFVRAYLYADSALTARDSVAAMTNTQALAKAHDKLEFTEHKLQSEKYKNQIKIAHLEIANNRIIITISIVGVCLLLIVLLFVARLYNTMKAQKKELELVNGVKDRIFSVISHDLRTPVNSLVSFTQLLEQGNLPPEKLQKYAAVLKDNLGYTARLMENLLNWARTQMQGYKPVPERFDISGIAGQIVDFYNAEARKKELQVINKILPGQVVLADMNMTSIILRNLLSNAIKYTPNGGTITLEANTETDKMRITITDTGVGMAAGSVSDFNKTSSGGHLDSTPGTNKEKGTGLGLMLCKGFVGLMNGTISVKSELGKGSCFTVELPVS